MNPGTKFTKEPPSTLYVPLGSAARFHWVFTFGDAKDWKDFDEIIWGKTDNSMYLRTKYVTLVKSGSFFNFIVDSSVISRARWIGNITQQQGCHITFILENVSKSDQITYGCTSSVWGEKIRSGPIRLVVTGECA